MPELPDVEVFGRTLARQALRRRIDRVQVLDEAHLREATRQLLGRRLKGHTFVGTRRHGKHLFAEVSAGGNLVLHFGMTGYLEVQAADDQLAQHARFAVHFEDGDRLVLVDQRRLGFVGWTDDADDYVARHGLGEDALAVSQPELRRLLQRRRGGLKAALMDQSLIAGLGNIYTDEVLFQARLHPQDDASAQHDAAYRRLHRQTRRVCTLAADRHADPERMPDTWLLPHREDGQSCPRCGGSVHKTRVGGRATFLCPRCQQRTGRRR